MFCRMFGSSSAGCRFGSLTDQQRGRANEGVLKSEHRIQSLLFKRTMSSEEDIIRGFQHIQGFSSFQYLENSSYNLSIASNQEHDRINVIERRGAPYLCKVKAMYHNIICIVGPSYGFRVASFPGLSREGERKA